MVVAGEGVVVAAGLTPTGAAVAGDGEVGPVSRSKMAARRTGYGRSPQARAVHHKWLWLSINARARCTAVVQCGQVSACGFLSSCRRCHNAGHLVRVRCSSMTAYTQASAPHVGCCCGCHGCCCASPQGYAVAVPATCCACTKEQARAVAVSNIGLLQVPGTKGRSAGAPSTRLLPPPRPALVAIDAAGYSACAG